MSDVSVVAPKLNGVGLSSARGFDTRSLPKTHVADNNLFWMCGGIAAGVAVIVLGLVLGLAHTSKNSATPSKIKYARPPVLTASQGTGVNVDARSLQCSPVSLKGEYAGLVPCTSQPECASSCMEDVQGFPYACVLVNNGTNTITKEGTLVEPFMVPFEVPVTSKECNGRGKRNSSTGVCICDNGFSGDNCSVYNLSVTTPGSYCLPPYMNQCDRSTSDTVLTSGPKGPEWTCQCKSKYLNLFAQDVEGGSCNKPLVCDATTTQKDEEHKPRLFDVFSHFDETMEPVFVQQAVKPNRLVSYNHLANEPCVASTTGRQPYSHNGGVPYSVVDVSPNADPTCQPRLFSNFCEAVPTTVSGVGNTLVLAVVRGSGTLKDPLRTRVDPPFFEPVPLALQRCPDQFSGGNSEGEPCSCACEISADPESNATAPCCNGKTEKCVPCDQNGVKLTKEDLGGTCVCKPGEVLMMRPTKESSCNTDTMPAKVYGDTWEAGVFDKDGEWNGAFTCLNDLRTASFGLASADSDPSKVLVVPDTQVLWNTVNGKGAVKPVSCLGNNDWLYRDSYDSANRDFVVNTSNCSRGFPGDGLQGESSGLKLNSEGSGVSKCGGVVGQRRSEWSAARDGPLVDDMNHNLPWFATATGSYGGQCECKGKMYVGSAGAWKELAQLGQYIIPAEGEDSWWTCAVDTCAASSSDPVHSHFDLSNVNTLFPRCICSKGGAGGGGGQTGYKTEISFLEQAAQVPRCIGDPCNPGGMKTSVHVPCMDGEEDACGGVCYKNRCFYKSPLPGAGGPGGCTKDADCAFIGNAGVPAVCKTSTDGDGKTTGVCLVMDKERLDAGSTCETDSECGLGTCTGFDSNGLGACSGGCACNTDLVQQQDNENPLGVSCAKRCDVYPCANKGVCSIEPVTGERQCACTPCFGGQYCQMPTNESQHNQPCNQNTASGWGHCCDPEYPRCVKNDPASGGFNNMTSCQRK